MGTASGGGPFGQLSLFSSLAPCQALFTSSASEHHALQELLATLQSHKHIDAPLSAVHTVAVTLNWQPTY